MKPSTTVKVRRPTHAKLSRIARDHRMTLADTVDALVEAWLRRGSRSTELLRKCQQK